jgi:hypothetical protein
MPRTFGHCTDFYTVLYTNIKNNAAAHRTENRLKPKNHQEVMQMSRRKNRQETDCSRGAQRTVKNPNKNRQEVRHKRETECCVERPRPRGCRQKRRSGKSNAYAPTSTATAAAPTPPSPPLSRGPNSSPPAIPTRVSHDR